MADIINLDDERKHQEALRDAIGGRYALDMMRFASMCEAYLRAPSENAWNEVIEALVESNPARVLTDDKLK